MDLFVVVSCESDPRDARIKKKNHNTALALRGKKQTNHVIRYLAQGPLHAFTTSYLKNYQIICLSLALCSLCLGDFCDFYALLGEKVFFPLFLCPIFKEKSMFEYVFSAVVYPFVFHLSNIKISALIQT